MLGSGHISHRRGMDAFGAWGTYVGTVLCHESLQGRDTGPQALEGTHIPPGLMLEGEGRGSGHCPCAQTSAEHHFISGLKP